MVHLHNGDREISVVLKENLIVLLAIPELLAIMAWPVTCSKRTLITLVFSLRFIFRFNY